MPLRYSGVDTIRDSSILPTLSAIFCSIGGSCFFALCSLLCCLTEEPFGKLLADPSSPFNFSLSVVSFEEDQVSSSCSIGDEAICRVVNDGNLCNPVQSIACRLSGYEEIRSG